MAVKTNASEERYVFLVSWQDPAADLVRKYQLTYFLRDKTVEMYDMKNRRPFLKRSECPDISEDQLYVGASVTIFSRRLDLVQYGDVFTRRALETRKSRTCAILKPDAYQNIGKILTEITKAGFVISQLRMMRFSRDQAESFYAKHRGQPFFDDICDLLSKDVCVAMDLVGNEAIASWRELMGPFDPEEARRTVPRSLRAQFGTDRVRNAVHGSDSLSTARHELNLLFEPSKPLPPTALFNNCTLCLIRPHAMKNAGEIVDRILRENFEISAMQVFYLHKAVAEEFLEVYKHVLPEHHDIVDQLCTGPCLAMEVRQQDAVDAFRRLTGPHDPEVALHLRSTTLRAHFGESRVKNAVHCTDLPEDGLLEVEFFFSLLQEGTGHGAPLSG